MTKKREIRCNFCNKDYRDRKDLGGLAFAGVLFCPNCQKKLLTSARKFKGEHLVTIRAKPREQFRNFAKRYLKSVEKDVPPQ
jgi:hypothetical protein